MNIQSLFDVAHDLALQVLYVCFAMRLSVGGLLGTIRKMRREKQLVR